MATRRTTTSTAVLAAIALVGGLAVAAPRLVGDDRETHKLANSNIDATGKTDVTAKLNGWLRRIPHKNVTIEFPAKARYKVEGTVLLDRFRNTVVKGNYAQLFAETDGSAARPNRDIWWQQANWPRNREQLVMQRSTDLSVRQLRIRGPNPGGPGTYNPTLEGQAGISIADCDRCEVRDGIINHTIGDGIEINRGNSDTTIASTQITYTGRQGISILNSLRTRVAENYLRQIGRTYFDLEPERGGFLHTVEVVDNTVVAPSGGIFVGSEGAGNIGDVTISGNKLEGVRLVVQHKNSDRVSRRGKIAITDNRTTYGFDNYPIGMIVIARTDGVTVTGNKATAKVNEAVRCEDCTDVTISGNTWQE